MNTKTRDALLNAVLHQLHAVMETLQALVVEGAQRVDLDAPCSHPESARRDLSTFGGPKIYLCRACGAVETMTDTHSEGSDGPAQ